MKELREAKRTYKNSFEQMQRYKQLASEAQAAADRFRDDLASSFSRGGGGLSSNGPDYSDTGGGGGTFDQLDDQEAFDRLENERVVANDPDSLAFFHAQKTRRALMTQNSGSIRSMQKNKRNR